MALNLISRIIAFFIVSLITWFICTNVLGWAHPFWSWYAPAFGLSFIGSYIIDGVVWLWKRKNSHEIHS